MPGAGQGRRPQDDGRWETRCRAPGGWRASGSAAGSLLSSQEGDVLAGTGGSQHRPTAVQMSDHSGMKNEPLGRSERASDVLSCFPSSRRGHRQAHTGHGPSAKPVHTRVQFPDSGLWQEGHRGHSPVRGCLCPEQGAESAPPRPGLDLTTSADDDFGGFTSRPRDKI